jgi:hypothetical protein
MHSKNLDAYLEQPDGINSLMPQAKRLLELRQVLLEVLPATLSGAASVANYRQGRIVIFAANSSVAAKLILIGPSLKEHFIRRGLQVTAMDIEVQPTAPAAARPPKTAFLSESARDALTRLSIQLPDSTLKRTVSDLLSKKVSGR